MYGLVNQALEHMVCDRHGEDTWEQVKLRADIDIEMFIGMRVYPDDLTFRLLEATSAVIDTSMPELVKANSRSSKRSGETLVTSIPLELPRGEGWRLIALVPLNQVFRQAGSQRLAWAVGLAAAAIALEFGAIGTYYSFTQVEPVVIP